MATLFSHASQCRDKVPFFTRDEALRIAALHFEQKREILYPYQCTYCRYIHNGHPVIDDVERCRTNRESLERSARYAAEWAAKRATKIEPREKRREDRHNREVHYQLAIASSQIVDLLPPIHHGWMTRTEREGEPRFYHCCLRCGTPPRDGQFVRMGQDYTDGCCTACGTNLLSMEMLFNVTEFAYIG